MRTLLLTAAVLTGTASATAAIAAPRGDAVVRRVLFTNETTLPWRAMTYRPLARMEEKHYVIFDPERIAPGEKFTITMPGYCSFAFVIMGDDKSPDEDGGPELHVEIDVCHNPNPQIRDTGVE